MRWDREEVESTTQLDISANIRRIIQERGLVQRSVADRAGFSAQQFCDMMSCRKIIRGKYMPKIANALGVNVSDLYFE